MRTSSSDTENVASSTRVQEIAFDVALRIADLIDLHGRSWPRSPLTTMSPQGAVIATYALLGDPEPALHGAGLVKCCIAMQHFAHHSWWGKGILRSLQVMAEERELGLPEALRRLFQDLEDRI